MEHLVKQCAGKLHEALTHHHFPSGSLEGKVVPSLERKTHLKFKEKLTYCLKFQMIIDKGGLNVVT